jgi:hypothetical protein
MPSSVVVAIPARNEAERIGACLAALHAQQGVGRFEIVVLANNCTDGTEALGRQWQDRLPGLRIVSVTLPAHLAHAGEARRRAMAEAAHVSAPDGVLLTTDADTQAPPQWIASNLAAITGVDAVAGRAVIDPVEARLIPHHLHRMDALEQDYAALLDEIAALLTPLQHDPWPRHDEHSGASIAVRLPAYLAAGGMPKLPTGEDRAFFDALRRGGALIRHAPEVWVTVSGRLEGRAKGGMAETIRARIARAPDWLDDRLEPVEDRICRLLQQGPVSEPMRRVRMADVLAQIAHAAAIRDRLRRGDRSVARPVAAAPAARGSDQPPQSTGLAAAFA